MALIDVLPSMVDAAGKKLAIMMDSGVRRGADVMKALALGAQAVLIGRATLYDTAAAGEAGAARAIDILHEETDRVMALIGACSAAEIDRRFLALPEETAGRGEAVAPMKVVLR